MPKSGQKCFNSMMSGLGKDKTIFKVQPKSKDGRARQAF